MLEKVKSARAILERLNLRATLLTIALLLTSVVLFTLWENRGVLLGPLITSPAKTPDLEFVFPVADQTKTSIRQLVERNHLIVGITIWAAEPKLNRRKAIYWFSDDPVVEAAFKGLEERQFGGIRLFTNDARNDAQMVRLINGEWGCDLFSTTINATLLPSLASRTPYICRVSLPPYFGEFSGYVAVSLKTVPSEDEVDQLRSDIVKLSTEIYYRDLLPSTKKRAAR